MPGSPRPVAVAMDVTPLLGVRTGVGASVAGFLHAVREDPDTGDHRVRTERPCREVAVRATFPRRCDPGGGSRSRRASS